MVPTKSNMAYTGGWIGVDLDGTLADYQGFRGAEHIGAPIPAMLLRVRRWLVQGKDIRIFTARVWPLALISVDDKIEQLVGANDREAQARDAAIYIRKWCQEHLGQVLPITCTKDYGMIQLWDDRAIQVELNTGRRVDGVNDLA
jgi:hypothetical protein